MGEVQPKAEVQPYASKSKTVSKRHYLEATLVSPHSCLTVQIVNNFACAPRSFPKPPTTSQAHWLASMFLQKSFVGTMPSCWVSGRLRQCRGTHLFSGMWFAAAAQPTSACTLLAAGPKNSGGCTCTAATGGPAVLARRCRPGRRAGL